MHRRRRDRGRKGDVSRSTARPVRSSGARWRLADGQLPAEFDDGPGAGPTRSGRSRLGVRANADTGADAARARESGAEGIGLCRTEHMFLGEDRLPVVRPHDPGRDRRGRGRRAGGAAERAAGRLRRDPRGHGRAPGDRAAARPAAARVPARRRGARGQARPRASSTPRRTSCSAAARRWQEAEPDARRPRRAPRRRRSPASTACRCGPCIEAAARTRAAGGNADRRDHDPARSSPARSWRWPARGSRRTHRRAPTPSGPIGTVADRHHDRDAPGRDPGRRDRRGGRLLLVRHQRPHPDDLRLQPGRRRGPR